MRTIAKATFIAILVLAAFGGFAQATSDIRTTPTALVVNGKWVKSSYDYDSQSGEYYFVVKGKREVFDDYFKKSKDYISNTIYAELIEITYKGKKYLRYGLPRVLSFDDITSVGKYNGLLVMAETGTKAKTPEVIYIPHTASMGSASFQPYMLKNK